MAVAIEFVNVIVRKAAVERSFPDGLDGFARQDIGNLTEDDLLLRVGYMSTSDAYNLVAELEAAGLRFDEKDPGSDIAVVWGSCEPPPWLSVGAVNGHWACWASDHPPGELAVPEPGFLLRCSREVYRSLSEVVQRCGVKLVPRDGDAEPAVLERLRCVRGEAELDLTIVGDRDADTPVGLMGWRQPARRAYFHADVALIRDLVAVLQDAGASLPEWG